MVDWQSFDVPTERNEIGGIEIGQPGRTDRLNWLKRGDRIRLPQGESNPINHLIIRDGRECRPFDPDNAHLTRRTEKRLGRDHHAGLADLGSLYRHPSQTRPKRPNTLNHHAIIVALTSAGAELSGCVETSQRGVGRWAPCRLAAWAAADTGFTNEDAAEGASHRPSVCAR